VKLHRVRENIECRRLNTIRGCGTILVMLLLLLMWRPLSRSDQGTLGSNPVDSYATGRTWRWNARPGEIGLSDTLISSSVRSGRARQVR
jgi:hypothetical protein